MYTMHAMPIMHWHGMCIMAGPGTNLNSCCDFDIFIKIIHHRP